MGMKYSCSPPAPELRSPGTGPGEERWVFWLCCFSFAERVKSSCASRLYRNDIHLSGSNRKWGLERQDVHEFICTNTYTTMCVYMTTAPFIWQSVPKHLLLCNSVFAGVLPLSAAFWTVERGIEQSRPCYAIAQESLDLYPWQ